MGKARQSASPPSSSFSLRARTLDGASTARSLAFPWLIVDGALPDGLKRLELLITRGAVAFRLLALLEA